MNNIIFLTILLDGPFPFDRNGREENDGPIWFPISTKPTEGGYKRKLRKFPHIHVTKQFDRSRTNQRLLTMTSRVNTESNSNSRDYPLCHSTVIWIVNSQMLGICSLESFV